jgi:hypothetical protein
LHRRFALRSQASPAHRRAFVVECNAMKPLRVLRAVLWSFFGVRRRADAERDLEGVPPHAVIAVGIVVAALFVIAIVGVVKYRPITPVTRRRRVCGAGAVDLSLWKPPCPPTSRPISSRSTTTRRCVS